MFIRMFSIDIALRWSAVFLEDSIDIENSQKDLSLEAQLPHG